MRVCALGACAAFLIVTGVAHASSRPSHVVVVTLPGFSWTTFERAEHPVLDRLIGTGAVAAVSVRTATKGSTPLRGYMTLGAGNRAYAMVQPVVRRDEGTGQVALRASDHFENGTAGEAMARRVVRRRVGGIVVPDAPALDAAQRDIHYGTHVGELGEVLFDHGIRRAVVIAGDESSAERRGAALAIVDRSGTIDTGTVAGLVRPSARAAYGFETDPAAFAGAVRAALATAQVVVAEPGETLRADEFALEATPSAGDAARVDALERTDALIGEVDALLTKRDVLYVVGVSSSLADARDHLTLAIAHGAGVTRGWLTSPTTHRAGVVALTDFAPTVLAHFEISAPSSMTGTAIRSFGSPAPGRLATLESLDTQSGFGDRFQGVAAKLVVVLLGGVAVAFAATLRYRRRWRSQTAWLCLAVLAVPPVAYLVRAAPVYRLGVVGAGVLIVAVVAAVATAALVVAVDAWKAGIALAGMAFAVTMGDLLVGAPLQVNNVFGYSPISAGRFYGDSNIAFAILVATTFIGLFAVLELRRANTLRAWAIGVIAVVIVLQGLPQIGADFGGVAASVPAALVAYAVARRRRVRVARLIAWAAVGGAAALGVALLDAARPAPSRTHLGRFAADLISGRGSEVFDVISRKVQSNFGLLGSAWSWTLLSAAVVLFVLVRTGALRDLIARRRMAAAGIAGTLVAGIVGFAVNDTGIWVLGMALAYAVPAVVLLSLGSTDGRVVLQGPAQAAGHRREGGAEG